MLSGRLAGGYLADTVGVLDVYCLFCVFLFAVGVGTWLVSTPIPGRSHPQSVDPQPISDNGTALSFCVLFGLASGQSLAPKSPAMLIAFSKGGFSILTSVSPVRILQAVSSIVQGCCCSADYAGRRSDSARLCSIDW